MNILKLATVPIGDAKTSRHFDHQPVQKTKAGFVDKLISVARDKIDTYKAQAREERGREQVLQMSDSMLGDIGLTPTDRSSLEAGVTSLEELNTRRESYRRKFD